MYESKAYSAASANSPLASVTIPRRDPTEPDVQIEILFCGVCHSDLHQVRNEWSSVMPTVYPVVPGHEIVGRVTKVGSKVINSSLETSLQSAAWSILTETALSVRLALSSSART
jgi:alcohol dehydrogenase (NADP+)